jgi:ERO1-like protein alpha
MWSVSVREHHNPDASYVNLIDNPESNTGYAGDEPRRIWDAIYRENCFHVMSTDRVSDMCLEERVFYRLISGLHTSITAHVFARWKLNPETSVWMGNQGLWNLVMSRFPDRLDNLYFTLNFLLRSLRTAQPFLPAISIDTGNAEADAATQQLLLTLANHNTDAKAQSQVQSASASPSEPANDFPRLFASPDRIQLKDDLKHMFRNVSNIMNCVGCEKCRVWGKLNTLGIATALKVALAEGSELEAVVRGLQRNEVVAWVNTLSSFSESVHYINEFSTLQPEAMVEAKPEIEEAPPAPSATADDAEDKGRFWQMLWLRFPSAKTVYLVAVTAIVVFAVMYRSQNTSFRQLSETAGRVKRD